MKSSAPVQLLSAATAREAHLVARKRGVVHLYTGPLTPSGRYVPRAGRTACNVRTRRLTVLPRTVALDLASPSLRACGRCSARLSRLSGRAEHISRDAAITRYGHLTAFDLALWAYLAVSEADVELVAWLGLLLLGLVACRDSQVVAPTGKTTGPLDSHVARARRRIGTTRDAYAWMRDLAEEGAQRSREIARQRRHDAWQEKEDRIERLGMALATGR